MRWGKIRCEDEVPHFLFYEEWGEAPHFLFYEEWGEVPHQIYEGSMLCYLNNLPIACNEKPQKISST